MRKAPLRRPDSLDFRQSRTFRIGQYWGAVSYLQILASELSDKLLAEILEMDAEMTVTLHIQTVDQLKAIKTIKGKISDIGKMKVEEQRKAVRAGYDPDILPPDLITFSKDAAELLADLQSRNERMFLLTFTVVNFAPVSYTHLDVYKRQRLWFRQSRFQKPGHEAAHGGRRHHPARHYADPSAVRPVLR